jgi:predicted ester cyclase
MTVADEAYRRGALEALERWTAGGDVVAPDARGWGAAPFGALDGAGIAGAMARLRRALPDLERRDDILLAGRNHPDERWTEPRAPRMVGCLGSYVGTFREPLAGIPPTGGVVALPFGEAHAVEDGRLRESWLFWDLVSLMKQADVWPMAPSLGAPGHWPAPKGGGGVRLVPSPDMRALEKVLEMHDFLNSFEPGRGIDTLDMSHWRPDFTYWAGGNIGACRGVEGFRAHHQIPYRRAFPGAVGAGHFIRLSDGPFAATGGDVRITHSAADYMGLPATGRTLRFRVMDFYRFDAGGLIAENWLPNDTIGLMEGLGVDVFGRLAHVTGSPRTAL